MYLHVFLIIFFILKAAIGGFVKFILLFIKQLGNFIACIVAPRALGSHLLTIYILIYLILHKLFSCKQTLLMLFCFLPVVFSHSVNGIHIKLKSGNAGQFYFLFLNTKYMKIK